MATVSGLINTGTTTLNSTTTIKGPIYFGSAIGSSAFKPVLVYSETYPQYGICYNNSGTDQMSFSASGNASSAKADLCINGNGDGTVTIRGNTIWHAGNLNFSGASFTSGQNDTGEHNCNNIKTNGHWYYTSNGPTSGSGSIGAMTADGALYTQAYSSSWVVQIAQDYRNGNLFTRSHKGSTDYGTSTGWQPWRKVVHSDIVSNLGECVSINTHDPNKAQQTHSYNLYVNGTVGGSAFYQTSDIRKKNIKSDLSLEKCYDLVDKCQTVIYSLKEQNKEQLGMIAQEIEEFFPEVIAVDEEGFKSLAYDRLVVICFKVLKDIIKRLEKLEKNGN